MTMSLQPMQRIGRFSSLTTFVLLQVSFRTAFPIAGSSIASVRVFQVPISFHWPAKRMTWIFGSFSQTA